VRSPRRFSSRPRPEHNGAVTAKGSFRIAALSGMGLGFYALLVRGSLTIDVGIGRTTRPLGPLVWRIAAPRELVFEVIAAPYLDRTPRALASKLRVLERGENMVLAEHLTAVGRLVTTTLETVRFERPERVHFRLLRGPVPYVVEQFDLRESDEGTELEYSGELGTDLWSLGEWWGGLVASRWEDAVRGSVAAIREEAERRAKRT
jgi:hypothetical protein